MGAITIRKNCGHRLRQRCLTQSRAWASTPSAILPELLQTDSEANTLLSLLA
jgi:hypothetical protein